MLYFEVNPGVGAHLQNIINIIGSNHVFSESVAFLLWRAVGNRKKTCSGGDRFMVEPEPQG